MAGATQQTTSNEPLTGQAYWANEERLAAQQNNGLITYEVPTGSNAWANYSGEGYQGQSTDLPSGYMDVQNTTDYSNYWD